MRDWAPVRSGSASYRSETAAGSPGSWREAFGYAEEGGFPGGDVFISTHVCRHAPTRLMIRCRYEFAGGDLQVNKEEVTDALDAVLLWIRPRKPDHQHRGFAISPTVRQGYILRVSEDLLDIMQTTTGRLPQVFALNAADITPYGNGLYHLNSILQPATATKARWWRCHYDGNHGSRMRTGAMHLEDMEDAARFMLETAKEYGRGAAPSMMRKSLKRSWSFTEQWNISRRWDGNNQQRCRILSKNGK